MFICYLHINDWDNIQFFGVASLLGGEIHSVTLVISDIGLSRNSTNTFVRCYFFYWLYYIYYLYKTNQP